MKNKKLTTLGKLSFVTSLKLFLDPRSYFFLALLLTTTALSCRLSAQSINEFSLTSNTKQCVALRQGQQCYKTITFRWQAQQLDDYCIVELSTRKIIQCWQQQDHGDVNVKFESADDETYALRKQNQTDNLASTDITISWAYKPKPEKSGGWRLF